MAVISCWMIRFFHFFCFPREIPFKWFSVQCGDFFFIVAAVLPPTAAFFSFRILFILFSFCATKYTTHIWIIWNSPNNNYMSCEVISKNCNLALFFFSYCYWLCFCCIVSIRLVHFELFLFVKQQFSYNFPFTVFEYIFFLLNICMLRHTYIECKDFNHKHKPSK